MREKTDTIRDYKWREPRKSLYDPYSVKVEFTPELYNRICAEARQRDWSFNRMVRHLCEAAIDGIE